MGRVVPKTPESFLLTFLAIERTIPVGSSSTLFLVHLKCSYYVLQTIFCLRYATIMMLSKTFASLAVLSVCTLAVGASPANFVRAACEFPS